MAKYDFGSSIADAGPFAEVEDADPRVGLVNLADVMLVFACGLMLALVSAWQLDPAQLTEYSKSDATVEISDPESLEEGGGAGYVDMGRVYYDPDTGKYYMEESGNE